MRRVTRATKLCRVRDISESAENGCPGCSLLSKGISVSAAQDSDPVHIIFVSGLPLRIESSDMDLEFYVPGAPFPSPNIGQARQISTSLDAALSARFAKEWLSRCESTHVVCGASLLGNREARPPKRFLDVGSIDGSEDPRLVETDNISSPYLALSYRWGEGKDENFKTTKSNIRERLVCIKYKQLPKTYQDAISITRHLGVRYIWIDALCIVQRDENEWWGEDDKKEWLEEAQKMGSVYQGALLTLSATCSSGVRQGFLGPRPIRQGYPLEEVEYPKAKISWTTYDGKTIDVFVRQRLAHSVIVPEDADPKGCPLLTRGWTFQERLLATRTLHFLPQELLWECKCDYWCECMSVAADQIWKTGEMRGSSYNRAMSDPQKINPVTLWQTLITDYSRRHLKEEKDRLLALSGIALQFKNSTLGIGRYLAGLWERGLLRHLIWQSDHCPRFQSEKRPSDVQMPERKLPSWSWIATSLPVRWTSLHHENLESDTQVLEAFCMYNDVDRLSQVESGRIVVSARVVDITIQAHHGGSFQLGVETAESTKIEFIPDATAAAIRLCVGDILFCAVIFNYTKDGDCIWVALALRPIMETNAKGSMVDVYRDRDDVFGKAERGGHNHPVYRPGYGLGFDKEDKTFIRVGIVKGTIPRENHYYQKDVRWFMGLNRSKIIIE